MSERKSGSELTKTVEAIHPTTLIVYNVVGGVVFIGCGAAIVILAIRGTGDLTSYAVLATFGIIGAFLMSPRLLGWLVKRAPLPSFLKPRDPK